MVGGIFHVKNFMYGQCTTLAESLVAIMTLVWLLLAVNVSVVTQMILTAERFAANVTWIWPLVCVCTLVYQQIVRLGKFTIAVFTDEALFGSGGPSRASKQPRVIGGVEWTRGGLG